VSTVVPVPHTLPSFSPAPLHRDRGVQVAVLWLGAIFAYNMAQDARADHVSGLVVGAPFLAAALVDRSRRVVFAGIAAALTLGLTSAAAGIPWDKSDTIRLIAVAVSTGIATWAAAVRIRALRNTVDVTEVARSVQTAVMRLQAPDTARATIALRYRASDVQALIGGDALEVVETKWGVRFLVADARGKGLGSLRASTLALGAFREWAHEEAELTDLLMRLHTSLARELSEDDFVTALVAQLDDLEFSFASAGHPFPMLVRQQVLTELSLDAITTPPLAMNVPHRTPRGASINLMAGDVVLMCTDGLLEARNGAGDYFATDVEASRCFTTPDVRHAVEQLLDAASRHSAGEIKDDIGIAAIRIDDGHRATTKS
jgi:serine phosphatase RsbU (regulator of sigma subunit)